MARNDTSKRQLLSANLKSAIATAAIVGTIGGWAALGTQQATTTTIASTQAVAQVADSAIVTELSSAQAQSAAQSSVGTSTSSTSARSPVTTTRSSS